MAASFQSKDPQVLGEQLKVQELVIKASSNIVSVSGSDLAVAIGEPLLECRACIKQIAAGTLSGIACTVSGNNIIITGESAAAATTVYILKYVINELA